MGKQMDVAKEFGETLLSAATAVGQGGARSARSLNPSSAEDNSPERQARIEELRRQMADGRYQVDASTLASRIVDDHLV